MEAQKVDDENVVGMTPPTSAMKTADVVAEVHSNLDAVDAIKAKAKDECEQYLISNKDIKKRFKNSGGDVAALNTIIKNQRNEMKLEAESKQSYDQMCLDLEPQETQH